MSQLGRISGQLLKDNLTRNGTDLVFDTDLFYLNVNARYIGANTDTPSKTLFVNGELNTTGFISPNGIDGITNFYLDINGNSIISQDNINFVAATSVNADNIRTDNISIYNNTISTLQPNAQLLIDPAGTGTVEINSDVKIYGSLNATGNLTLDGNIIFGDGDTDSITLAADVNSDIIPNLTETYDIGSNQKQWQTLYTKLVNGQVVDTLSILTNGIDPLLRQGNIWYVATNGNDGNVGDHQNGPFSSIAKALSEATAGDTVFIYPGTYNEITPLTVPAGVSVRGIGLRSVTIIPDSTTTSENVFLLNGETTVSDLTVKNFYYDSVNDTGYAFSFAPGITVTSRSPYVQNVTVITQGTTITGSDPRGFASGDAGKGARVDGSLANAASIEASMLFHSCTFICPGVDTITMLNGVRVEWLNSFTYYANRGLYALNGTAGLANLGVRFGAEIRSIGSANVYGNYGAEANGSSTLMYLINHNFAYIGAGKDTANDPSLNIAANETVELGGGKIYYQSLDNKGNYKVGDAFAVDFETGRVTISGLSVGAGGVTSINFASGTDETVIDASQVLVNNIRFSGNTLSSISGEVELKSVTNELNVSYDVYADKNIDVDGNFTIGGKITIGNELIDVITFVAPVEYSLRPIVDNTHNLGSGLKRWEKVIVFDSYIGNLKVSDNIITTLDSNADLVLGASGVGRVFVPFDNTQFNQDLTVIGITATKNVEITGSLTHTGNINRTGTTTEFGNYIITGNQNIIGSSQYPDIKISGNTIETTQSNSNLLLDAAGTGQVYAPFSNVLINNNLTVDQTTTVGSSTVSGSTTALSYTNSNITISSNVIQTTVSNSDLELRAAGTGRIYVPSDNVEIDNNLTVDGTTNFATTGINATVNQIGTVAQTGNTGQTGNRNIVGDLTVTSTVDFGNIEFINNQILTTVSNSDLELKAIGTGKLVIPNNNAQVDNNLTVLGTINSSSAVVTGSTTSLTYTNSNITISSNIIQTTVSNSDLELRAAGTGRVYVPSDNVKIDNNLTVDGTTNFATTNITGALTHIGTVSRTGSITQSGNNNIIGQLSVTSSADFGDIEFVNNRIFTTRSNSNLELKAVGTGKIIIPGNDVQVDTNLSVLGTITANSSTVTGSVQSATYTNSNITISSNVIQTTVSNSDLELRAAGTGRIYVPSDNVEIDNNLTVDGTTNLAVTNITGTLTHIGLQSQTGNYTQTGNRFITGQLNVTSTVDFGDIEFVSNRIFTTRSNSNLELKTAGTGKVNFVDSLQIDQAANFNNLISNNITNSNLITSNMFYDNNIEIFDNVIRTTTSNSDLELSANNLGIVSVPLDAFVVSQNFTVTLSSSLANSDITGLLTHVGDTVQTGNNNQVGDLNIVGDLTVNTDAYFENINFVNNSITTVNSNSNLELRAAGTGKVIVNDNLILGKGLSVIGNWTTNNLNNSSQILSQSFSNGTILIQDNFIATTISNSNLELVGNGTGRPALEKIHFKPNTISTESNNDNIILNAPTSNVKINALTALKVPTGTTAQRPTLTQADIRFNTTQGLYNGFSTANVTFAGIYSDNQATRVLAHPTNNTLNFFVSNVQEALIDNNGITVNQLTIDSNLRFNNNTLVTQSLNSDIVFTTTGTGKTIIDSFAVGATNEFFGITNNPITLNNTGDSYVKFAGTNAMVIPVGNNSNRPNNPEVGDIRFNTQAGIPEVFNGTAYQSFIGDQGAILGQSEVDEIMNVWSLILG